MPVTNYIWDVENDSYLMETDEAGDTTAVYTNEPGHYGPLISQRREGQTSYYHFDGQQSTRQLTDENQNVTDEYTYTAFGETVASSGATTNPFGYKGALGYYANPETKELYIRARAFAPRINRFLSKDPLPFLDGANTYTYVNNSPVGDGDPSGLSVYVVGWEGFGAKPPKGLPRTSLDVLTSVYKPIALAALPDNTNVFFGAQQNLIWKGARNEAEAIVNLAKTPEYYVTCYPCYPRIVLVGYSWGGNTARKVVEAIQGIDPTVAIDAVFTIDPVIGNVYRSGRHISNPRPNVCRWDSFYQRTSRFPPGTGYHGDSIDVADNSEVLKEDFVNGQYSGWPGPLPSLRPQRGHVLIPFLKSIQDDFESILTEFDKTLGRGRDHWSYCGATDICLK